MIIQLNGASHETSDDVTVAELVELLARDPRGRGVAVAVDGVVVIRSEWSDTAIASGQRVEIVEAQQGG